MSWYRALDKRLAVLVADVRVILPLLRPGSEALKHCHCAYLHLVLAAKELQELAEAEDSAHLRRTTETGGDDDGGRYGQ